MIVAMNAGIAFADQYTAVYPGGDPSVGKGLIQKIASVAMRVASAVMALLSTPVRIV